MVNFTSILAALFCATAPFSTVIMTESKEERVQEETSGKETIASLRAAYENGKYNDFLNQAEADYAQALSDNGLEGLIVMRNKQVPADFQEKWQDRFLSLQQAKNAELLGAISDKDDSVFAKKVRSIATNTSTDSQEKALFKLNSLITKAPKTGANTDENRLIDLDLEYEYKQLHAQLPTSDVSPQEQANRQIVLRMEKMDKMVQASKDFTDHSLKQSVGLAAANLDTRLARNLDGTELNALVKSKAKPANETEEKVYSIVAFYQGQFSDLMKDIADENHQ